MSNDFANTLKKLRANKDITQAELAKALGVGKSTISMYETGAREPDFETLEAIADYFNIPMADLIRSTEQESNQENLLRTISDDDLKFALFGDRNIDDDLLNEVRLFAQFAKEKKKSDKNQ